jgi:uncharacterized protein (TIGR00375 family)
MYLFNPGYKYSPPGFNMDNENTGRTGRASHLILISGAEYLSMKVVADFHIHSRHSRACSSAITIDNLEKWAKIKGLDVLGTGDFQHPAWNREIKEKLKEDGNGILRSASGFPFIWQTEISLMYSGGGRRRAVHLVMLAPDCETADKLIKYLGSKGRLDYDGRPIFGMKAADLVGDVKNIDDRIELIPAHCMTPWFGLFGSDSGFDSIGQCFGGQAENIYAVESGMSADPAMLWRLNENVNIVSFSDSHSFWPWRLGREATIFSADKLSYENIINAIRTGKGLEGTIETPPEYGKYHWDGHRVCGFSAGPDETKKLGGVCPVCRKPLTIGVENRAEQLATMPTGFRPARAKPFHSLLPLSEIISAMTGSPVASKSVWKTYNALVAGRGEFSVLLEMAENDIAALSAPEIAMAVCDARNGRVRMKPGYDGVYGEPAFEGAPARPKEPEAKRPRPQKSLFDFG